MEHNPDRDQVIYGLTRKRAELAGQIEHFENCLAQAEADLIHVDAVLAMYGVDKPDQKIKPKRASTTGIFFRKELSRRIIALLRDDTEGKTSLELAALVCRDKGWELDRRFQVALAAKITRHMNVLRKQDRVSAERVNRQMVWRVRT